MRSGIALIVLMLIVAISAHAQKPEMTTSFRVVGEVKKELVIGLDEIARHKVYEIGDVVITNHLGEKRSDSKGLRGVRLIDVLASLEITSPSPRELSEYYFVCKAKDGYTVVYSWNELFNSPNGETVYLIVSKNGKDITAMDDSILMLSSRDFKTGRRQVKSLAEISVKRAQ